MTLAKLIALTEQTAYGHGVADSPKPVAVFEKPDGTTETLSLDSVKFDAQLGDLADLVYAGTQYVAHKTKTKFSKYEYQAAKQFIKGATIEKQFITPSFHRTVWVKPDGTRWQECDSQLEAPEDDYSLELIFN